VLGLTALQIPTCSASCGLSGDYSEAGRSVVGS
jgi:hypothetical protein